METSPVLLLIERCRELQQLHEAKNRSYPLQLEIPSWRDNEVNGPSSDDDEQQENG